MKMARHETIVNERREKLEEVLPLTTPYSVFIDVCNACNFKCNFCSHQCSDEPVRYKKQSMDFKLYKKIIDEFSLFDEPIRMLRLAAGGEPFINPYFAEMVDYAKSKKISKWIETVTNGSLITPEVTDKLVGGGVKPIKNLH